MSARRDPKEKHMSMAEKTDHLRKLFPEISAIVVELVLENCTGDVDEAKDHLREMDLELWSAKNTTPVMKTHGTSSDVLETTTTRHVEERKHSLDSFAGFEFVKEFVPSSSFTDKENEEQIWNQHTKDISRFLPDSSSETSGSSTSSADLRFSCFVPEETLMTDSSTDFISDTPYLTELNFRPDNENAGTDTDHHLQAETGAALPCYQDNGMRLTLDKDLAIKLILTFGLMQVPIDTNDQANLTVELDTNTAYKLYQAWKATQESAALLAEVGPVSEDEQLAQALQDLEHENYAENNLRGLSMKEIMDETMALQMAEQESELRGMDVNAALQYQSSSGVESKWVDVLLKSHNVVSDSSFPSLDSKPQDVYAPPPVRVVNQTQEPSLAQILRPTSGQKVLKVTPIIAVTTPATNPKVEPLDYYGARREALALQKKAVQYGHMAGKAFGDKKLGGGAAAYYLQKSHEHKSLAKDAHFEASQDILALRNCNASEGEIDLHGLRSDEVAASLDIFFGRKHNKKEIKIITGRGAHSRHGTSEVKRAVEIYLKKHGFPFEEGPPAGVFYVEKWQKLSPRPP